MFFHMQALEWSCNLLASLTGDQGLLTLDLMQCDKPGFPESSISRLHTLCQRILHPASQPVDVSPAAVLASAALHGLVPRPGTGSRISRCATFKLLYPSSTSAVHSHCLWYLVSFFCGQILITLVRTSCSTHQAWSRYVCYPLLPS